MLLPTTTQSALLVLFLAFICFSSWANLFKASRWRYELFYFDFALGAVILALIGAYTLGTVGSDMSFLDRTVVAGLRSEAIALAAGASFGLGNLLLLAGVALAGMWIAFPFALSVALLVVNSLQFRSASALGSSSVILLYLVCTLAMVVAVIRRRPIEITSASARTPGFHSGTAIKAASVCVVAGILIGISYPIGDAAFWGDLGLGPYAGTLFFCLGLLGITVFLNVFFMNIGLAGGRVTLPMYLQATLRTHLAGVGGGAIWAAGLLSSLLGRSVVTLPGWSLWLEQGWVLMAVVWGLVLWKEHSAVSKTSSLSVFVGCIVFAGAIAAGTFVGR